MYLHPPDCWDCPLPLSTFLWVASAGVVAIGLTALCWGSGRRPLRLLAACIAPFVAIWYAMFTYAVMRYQVLWPVTIRSLRFPPVASQAADIVFLVASYALSVLVALLVRHVSHRLVPRNHVGRCLAAPDRARGERPGTRSPGEDAHSN